MIQSFPLLENHKIKGSIESESLWSVSVHMSLMKNMAGPTVYFFILIGTFRTKNLKALDEKYSNSRLF